LIRQNARHPISNTRGGGGGGGGGAMTVRGTAGVHGEL